MDWRDLWSAKLSQSQQHSQLNPPKTSESGLSSSSILITNLNNIFIHCQQVVRRGVAGFQEEPATQAPPHAIGLETNQPQRWKPHFKTACFNHGASESALKRKLQLQFNAQLWISVSTPLISMAVQCQDWVEENGKNHLLDLLGQSPTTHHRCGACWW